MLSELRGGFAETFPGIEQVFGESFEERCLRGGPAVVLVALVDPLFAVIAGVPVGHGLTIALSWPSTPARKPTRQAREACALKHPIVYRQSVFSLLF